MRAAIVVVGIGFVVSLIHQPSALSQSGTVKTEPLFEVGMKSWISLGGKSKSTWRYNNAGTLNSGKNPDTLVLPKSFGDGTLELEYRFIASKEKDAKYQAKILVRQVEGRGPHIFLGNEDAKIATSVTGSCEKDIEFAAVLESDIKVEKVGDWNKLTITCKGSSITTHLNGKLAYIQELEQIAPNGALCLQSFGSEIEFRDLKWTPLGK